MYMYMYIYNLHLQSTSEQNTQTTLTELCQDENSDYHFEPLWLPGVEQGEQQEGEGGHQEQVVEHGREDSAGPIRVRGVVGD